MLFELGHIFLHSDFNAIRNSKHGKFLSKIFTESLIPKSLYIGQGMSKKKKKYFLIQRAIFYFWCLTRNNRNTLIIIVIWSCLFKEHAKSLTFAEIPQSRSMDKVHFDVRWEIYDSLYVQGNGLKILQLRHLKSNTWMSLLMHL